MKPLLGPKLEDEPPIKIHVRMYFNPIILDVATQTHIYESSKSHGKDMDPIRKVQVILLMEIHFYTVLTSIQTFSGIASGAGFFHQV